MKHIYKLFFLGALICILAGCSDSYTIDYLPVKTEKGGDWGFINSKGEIFLEDEFEHKPSNVVEGLFSVREGDYYTLYRFDEKKPKEILSDLVYVGEANGGMLPVTKKDSKIEVVDLDGKTLFTLDKIDGKTVNTCNYRYDDFGYLLVQVIDGSKECMTIVDRDGNPLFKPKYDGVFALAEDLIIAVQVSQNDGERKVEYSFLNKKGDKLKNWKFDDDCDINVFGEYVVIRRDEKWHIYDLKGEEILKCKDKIKGIINIKDDLVIVRDEDRKMGVIDLKGENVVSTKYESIIITDDGFFAQKDNDDEYEFLNRKGEKQQSTDWSEIFTVTGFGFLAHEKSDDNFRMQYIINDKGEQINKNDMFDIDNNISCSSISSDFFDCGEITNAIISGIESDLNNHGVQLGGLISACDLGEPSVSYSYCQYPYMTGNKFSISLSLYSNDPMRVPVYSTRTVQRYNWYYGYYNDTERYLDHYEPNSEATISTIDFTITCPDKKVDNLFEALCKAISDKGSFVQEGYYMLGNKHVLIQKGGNSNIDVYVSLESLEFFISDAGLDEYESIEFDDEPVEEVAEAEW